MNDFVESALRVWLVIAGLIIAGHYHAMANYIRRAPHLVRGILLPAITGASVGMAYCGVVGMTFHGAMLGTLSAGLMSAINLAAWSSGAYVSSMFDRAAEMRERIHRRGYLFVSDIRSMADAVNLPEAEERKKERQQ
jgi:hypothetical protein